MVRTPPQDVFDSFSKACADTGLRTPLSREVYRDLVTILLYSSIIGPSRLCVYATDKLFGNCVLSVGNGTGLTYYRPFINIKTAQKLSPKF